MKKTTIVASIGVVIFVLLIGWSIAKIAGTGRFTGAVLNATNPVTAPTPTVATGGANAPLTAYYVVCEEADKYGAPDPGTAAGTIVIVSYTDLRNVSNVLFQPNGGNGRTGDILQSIGTNSWQSLGGYNIFTDQAYASADPITIEPGQSKINVSNGGLLSYYCDSSLSGKSSSPVVVSSGANGYLNTVLDQSVKKVFKDISTFSSASWNLKIYGHTFTGTAHQTP